MGQELAVTGKGRLGGDQVHREYGSGRGTGGGGSPAPRAALPGWRGPPLLDRAFGGGSLDALRAAVAGQAVAAGLPGDRADDLVVAVHELAANAVLHGAGHGRLRLWLAGQMLCCQVSDEGRRRAGQRWRAALAAWCWLRRRAGVTVAPGEEGWRPAPWPIEHGHGLWLVREVADQMSLQSGLAGSTATIGFRLTGEG
jgi:hypothetical protein